MSSKSSLSEARKPSRMARTVLRQGHWLRDRRGATSIEYGLISALIGLAALALGGTGNQLSTTLNTVSTSMQPQGGPAAAPVGIPGQAPG